MAASVLRYFSIRGYVMDKERLKNGTFLNEEKENMGLTTWRNAHKGKILKSDVSVAKNYLSLEEMDSGKDYSRNCKSFC